MPFGPVDPTLDLPALEDAVLARWRELDLPGEVSRARKDAEPWVFYEGPPTANGRPGLHHVWARVFKDLYPRFWTMRGRRVPRKGGWDCHGLPVEIEVERALGFEHKEEIEAYGVAEFNQRCRESVERFGEDFAALTERSGVWIDTRNAYWTMSNEYIESVWWLLRRLWDDGLLYEGHRVSPYCARCGTALSSHELGQPGAYQDVVDPSVYVRFPLDDRDADLLVWTTTPWTLVSNVAAAVGPEVDYVQVHDPERGRDLVLAAARAVALYGDLEVVARLSADDLAGLTYSRPYDLLPFPDGYRPRVVVADYVSVDDGSGIVHIAPAFGSEDAEVGRAERLPVLNPVGPDGAFDHRVPAWNGTFVKDADPAIVLDLRARGLLVREAAYKHAYPHCWRCGTPLIYWAKTSWFVRTSERKADLLAQNETVSWYPGHIKHGRFGDWLENNVDWALSRDRYWGTPLPIWRCRADHDTCIGSVEELAGLVGRDLGDLDLHRPYVDEVTFPCPVDGCTSTSRRLPPVLDAWFDSGSMPSAQHHYPFGDAQAFEDAFPADFICEAIDQTRGWFYSLLAVNTLVFGKAPFRNVVCLNLVVDADGQKMSKSRGNVVDPWHIFRTFGSDALRWYFFSAGSPWTARRVSEDGIREATRKTLLTYWNVLSFFATYADLDGWEPGSEIAEATHVLDRWVLGELDRTVAEVTAALERFDALAASNRIGTFVDDLSNWYVRRSRPRFWKSSDPVAHATLHRCLVTTAELLAPFTPFLADEAWRRLTAGTSVHLADWPVATADRDAELAEQMGGVRRLVALGRAARTDAKVKTRQPLRRALLLHPGFTLDDAVRAELEAELNVKLTEDVETLSGLITWRVVPNFRVLGPRLGPKVAEVKAALAAADGSELHAHLARDGFIEVAGERLGQDDVEVRAASHESFALAQEGAWAVALDLELDDELRVEGTARELVRALNDLRKDQGLALSDRVAVVLAETPAVRAAVEGHGAHVAEEVLAVSLEVGAGGPLSVELDGEAVAVSLVRV